MEGGGDYGRRRGLRKEKRIMKGGEDYEGIMKGGEVYGRRKGLRKEERAVLLLGKQAESS